MVKVFGAVQHPVFAIARRGGASAAGVRASFRLGQRPCAQLLALSEGHEIFALLFFVGELVDVVGAERIVGRDGEPDGTVDARELFNHRGVFDVAQPRAAIFLRKNDA